MKRIRILAEGHTEQEFIQELLAPHLMERYGLFDVNAILIKTSGGGKGGFSNLDRLKPNLRPLLTESNLVVSTMLDLFRFPTESGNTHIQTEAKRCYALPMPKRIEQLEHLLETIVKDIRKSASTIFIPYIQQHEFEALLFASPKAFTIINDQMVAPVEEICRQASPEDINSTPQGHPAQRLEELFLSIDNRHYNKMIDGIDVLKEAKIQAILNSCPRFSNWVLRLAAAANMP